MTAANTDFLPAVLAICERPPHPLARWLMLASIAFTALALLWACIGTVDIVATAEGRILPSSRVQQIQPLEKGVVQRIAVREGQQVHEGDVLLELDRTQTTALRNRLAADLQKTVDDLAREQALLARLLAQPEPVTAIAQQAQLEQQWQQYRAQREALLQQHNSRQAERAANRELVTQLQATLPLLTQRTASLQQLAARKLIAEHQYLEQEEQRITRQQELAAAHARDRQLAAASAESQQQLAALEASAQTGSRAKISELLHQQHNLGEQLRQAEDADAKLLLHAPLDGQVKDLAVHTVGGVVQEAQQLMLLVPSDQPLEVEAWLANRDIGFVREGDRAVIKVHTFPFTKYGSVPASVVEISADAAAEDERGRGQDRLHYRMLLRLVQDHIAVDGRAVPLLPGMQVTAEVISGERRIIEYFLAPLQQRAQEGLRER